MSKRLQVLLEEDELAAIGRVARARRITVAEWVRGVLRAAQREEPAAPPERKLAVVRAATRHAFPTADVDQMVAEIEAGYGAAGAGLEPLVLEPKESLALMNGTSVMTALACIAHERATAAARLAASITALGSHALAGNPAHFAPEIFELKPHRGTREAKEARVTPV